jgi:hypothetical protein
MKPMENAEGTKNRISKTISDFPPEKEACHLIHKYYCLNHTEATRITFFRQRTIYKILWCTEINKVFPKIGQKLKPD